MPKIDKKDLKIIELLEQNSRQSLSKIAKTLKLSPQRVFYRINRLTQEKVITSFPTIIDPAYLHLIEANVHFKISYISENKLKEIIEYFQDHDYVTSIIECGSNWDLIVSYSIKNLSKFNKILHKDLEKFPKQFSNYEILFSVVSHFFINNPQRTNIIIGGDRPLMDLDKSELLIAYHLNLDSKISILDLSKKVKKDPKTIIKKIKTLKKSGFIREFTIEVDNSKIGYSSHKLLISYNKPTLEAEEKNFLKFIKKQLEIIKLTKLMGKYNLVLNIKIKDEIELRRLIFRLRENYSDIIHEILDIPVYKVHKLTYLPKNTI